MSWLKDDWEKPRNRGQHLSKDEIGLLRASYKAGHSSREAARALKCSSRIADKYYSFFKAEGVPRGGAPFDPSQPAPRHYRSNFET